MDHSARRWGDSLGREGHAQHGPICTRLRTWQNQRKGEQISGHQGLLWGKGGGETQGLKILGSEMILYEAAGGYAACSSKPTGLSRHKQ